MLKEELHKKHLEAIENCAKVLWGQDFTDVPQAATACTTITIQTVVEVLESIRLESTPAARDYVIDPELNYYKKLLNQK